jgi:hypothetical protein
MLKICAVNVERNVLVLLPMLYSVNTDSIVMQPSSFITVS